METNDLCHISEAGNWSKITSLSGGFSLRLVASGGLIVNLPEQLFLLSLQAFGHVELCLPLSFPSPYKPATCSAQDTMASTYHPRTALRKNGHTPKSFGISFFNIVHSYILFHQRIPVRQEAHGQKVSFYLWVYMEVSGWSSLIRLMLCYVCAGVEEGQGPKG